MQQRGYSFWIVGLSVLIGVGVLLFLYLLMELRNVGAFSLTGRASPFLYF